MPPRDIVTHGTARFNDQELTTLARLLEVGGGPGGSPLLSDDGKDRGILFQWHTGTSARTGFFGFDRSSSSFIFVPEATVTNGAVSGTKVPLVSQSEVTTAIGYVPYDSANPNQFITRTSTFTASDHGTVPSPGTPTGRFLSDNGSWVSPPTGVSSFNTRTGLVSLSSQDVTDALTFVPYSSDNPAGYITGVTQSEVVSGLGYTPVNKAGDSMSGDLSVIKSSATLTVQSSDASPAKVVLKDLSTTNDLLVGSAGQDLTIQAGGTERLRLLSTGSLRLTNASSSVRIYTGSVTDTGFALNSVSNFIAFITNGTERARLNDVGRLGIGTSAPQCPLNVLAASGELCRFTTNEGSTTQRAGLSVRGTGGASGRQTRLILDPNGGDGLNSDYFEIEANQDGSTKLGNRLSGILEFQTNSSTKLTIDVPGNLYGIPGTTSMTGGFFYIPSAGGPPTGVPTTVAGRVPLYFDSSTNELYIYNGSWKKTALV